MISSNNLIKEFGKFKAVDSLNLNVHAGECFGLLGPNGAGKSTFINMVYGMVVRTSGDLKVFGMDPNQDGRKIKKRIGVVTQENALDESLSVKENMLLYSSFLGVPSSDRKKKVSDLLEYMNLGHKADSKIQSLSGGMKRRLVFVRALLGSPELLILDEPTTGLDPAVRHLLWSKVKELRSQGTTVLLTTHYMHEAEVLCDRVVILNKGKVATEGTPEKLINTHTPGYVGVFSIESKSQITELIKREPKLSFFEDRAGIYLRSKEISTLIELPQAQGIKPLQIRPSNLEDVFLNISGQELSQDD